MNIRESAAQFLFVMFVMVIVAVGFTLLLTVVVRPDHTRYDSFETHCAQAGGHIYRPDNTAWCLTTDERFIEVYP